MSCCLSWWQGSAGMFARKHWNGGDSRCAGPRSLRASAAKTPWKARCIGRGRPSQTIFGKSIHRRSDWRSGRCRNRETRCLLRGEAWGGDDEDAGICSAPALCGYGIYVFPNRKPASASCWPRGRPVCRACTKQCYLRALPPLWHVPGTANRCTNNNEALPIWTSMPSNNKRWWRTNRWRKRWKESRTQHLMTQFPVKTREQKTQRK